MTRLELIGEMDINHYADEDIEYMQALLGFDKELISEGAAFTLYTSTKYLIVKIATDFQKYCTEVVKTKLPKEIRMIYYINCKKLLPQIVINFKGGDFEKYVDSELRILYRTIIMNKLGIEL